MSATDMNEWDQFFIANPAPEDFGKTQSLIENFVRECSEKSQSICLVTSGKILELTNSLLFNIL